jgi:outer membrane cobalamin receptor
MIDTRRRLLGGCAAAACLALGAGAHAEAAADATTVEEVVVTGRSLEQTTPIELSKLGHDLVVVTGETIKNKSYVDTASALQMEVPGLYVAQQAGPFSYVYMSLQGSRIQDVLWTVDGVRVNNRLYSTTAPNDTLPASMIERIEVLKGGESLFYGTQGVAGVINVVTRSFSNRTGGEVNLGGDTNDSWHADGYLRGAAGRHRYVAFANVDKSDGFEAFDVYQPSATARKRGYDERTGGFKYGYDFTDDLAFSASWIHTDADLDYPGARLTAFSQNQRDEEIMSAKLDYAPDEGLQFYVKGYHHDWNSHYTTIENDLANPGTTNVTDDNLFWGYKDTGANVLAKLPVGKVDVLAGYDFQTFKGRDDVLIIEQLSEDVHAVFGQLRTNKTFSDRGSFAVGMRYNKTGETTATVWNVSGRYDLTPSLFVQANAGTGFSLPTAEQLFAVDPFSTFGNPELKPEESRNLNVSIGGRFAGDAEWQLTGFKRDVDDLITFSTDLSLIPASVQAHPDFASAGEAYINLGEVEFSGFEASLAKRLMEGVTVSASYTQTDAKAKGSSVQLDRIPEELAKAQIAWAPADSRFGGSATALWTGDVFQTISGNRINYGDYYVLDLAAHAFLDNDHKQKLTFRVQNAFDEDYATRVNSAPVDPPGVGRFIFNNRGTPRTFHIRYSYAFGG